MCKKDPLHYNLVKLWDGMESKDRGRGAKMRWSVIFLRQSVVVTIIAALQLQRMTK